MAHYPAYETLRVSEAAPHVLHVELSRPEKRNSMTSQFWTDVRNFFAALEEDGEVRAVVLSGQGPLFTAGLDMSSGGLAGSGGADKEEAARLDLARRALNIRRTGKLWQQSFDNIESCGKAVIACVHSGCWGAGVEMISACDIRFCTSDAYYVMKEVDIGMAADVGGLQRFPKLVGNQSLVRELALSGRRLGAREAFQHGFVSQLFDDKDQMMAAALELAGQIAAKSPVATLGVKRFLNYARDHSVEESLDYAITWNMSMLQSADLMKAGAAMMAKQTPTFSNLSGAPRSKL
mmetsp:Transcript_6481/g.13346  ORF Transcript_6481/g.13346 Transcript_6481/m.13346 type:complete len:292 (-) Transcript_6481:97-972(-)